MARRSSKAESQLMALLIIIGLPIFLVVSLAKGAVESLGPIGALLVLVGCVAAVIIYTGKQKAKKRIALEQRRVMLLEKYGNHEVVENIISRSFWQGQTAEQLMDSLGNPHDTDFKVLKTKTKEVWKYRHQGANRYGLRITLENDEVIGWDQKN